MKRVTDKRLQQIVGAGAMWCGDPETRAMAEELQQLRRIRFAFEDYIRDRRHLVEMSDADVEAEMKEWIVFDDERTCLKCGSCLDNKNEQGVFCLQCIKKMGKLQESK